MGVFLFCLNIGTVESNSQTSEAICLTISFHMYNRKGPIYYPPFDKVCEECRYFVLASLHLMADVLNHVIHCRREYM